MTAEMNIFGLAEKSGYAKNGAFQIISFEDIKEAMLDPSDFPPHLPKIFKEYRKTTDPYDKQALRNAYYYLNKDLRENIAMHDEKMTIKLNIFEKLLSDTQDISIMVDNIRHQEILPLSEMKPFILTLKQTALYVVGKTPIITMPHYVALLEMSTIQEIEKHIENTKAVFEKNKYSKNADGFNRTLLSMKKFVKANRDVHLNQDTLEKWQGKLPTYSKNDILFYHHKNRLDEALEVCHKYGYTVTLDMIDRAESAGWTEGQDLQGYV